MQVIIPTVTTDGTFSRASSATYYNSSGVLSTVTNDVIRIGYNPASLTDPPMAVIETAATNLIIRSEEFDNASWTKVGTLSVTANSTVAPDGNTTADTLTDSDAVSSTLVAQATVATGVSGNLYSSSIYVKKGTLTACTLNSFSNGGAERNTTFQFATSTTLSVSLNNATSYSWQYVGNGWFRITHTITADTNNALTLRFWPDDRSIQSTTGTVFVWGAQLEAGNPTSYIKTGAATVTRAADLITNGLLYSNIAEPDATWPAWNSGTAYVVGNKVSYLHRQYNCVVNNTNRNPLTDTTLPPAWTDAGPTNRYAMFDQVIGTSTTNASSIIQVVLKGDHLNGLSLMQMAADKVQISVMVDNVLQYSRTLDLTSGAIVDWYQYFYSPILRTTDYVLTDLTDITGAIITVTITTGSGTVSIGNLVNGNIYNFINTGSSSSTSTSPTVGIISYAIKTVDSFGNTKVTPRGYAKRMNTKLMLDSTSVDRATTILSSIVSTPCVWIGADNLYQSLIVYGYYKDWEIEIAYTTKSFCSLNIEGLI